MLIGEINMNRILELAGIVSDGLNIFEVIFCLLTDSVVNRNANNETHKIIPTMTNVVFNGSLE
ncbi:hypothetical protein MASR2M36_05440 [Providencia sp.]